MYIITTSFIIEPPMHEQWYEFFTKKFIPYIKTEGFNDMTFTRVLHEHNTGDYTYSLQLRITELTDFSRFTKDIMEEYNEISKPLFDTLVLHFTTLMKVIEL